MPSGRSDLEVMRLFTNCVQRLVERRGIRDGTITSRFNLQASAVRTSFAFDVGDQDDLFSTMTAFRLFTAPSEDTHFPRVCNVLERMLSDTELREANRENRAAWLRAERGDVLLQVPGHNLNERAAYDLWTNAEVFHADRDKEALYRGLPAEMQGFIRTRASSFVITGTRILCAQRNVADAHLRSVGR